MEFEYLNTTHLSAELSYFLQRHSPKNSADRHYDQLMQLQSAKNRRITRQEIQLMEQQNNLLESIKNSIGNKKINGTNKSIEDTFDTTRTLNTSTSFIKTQKDLSFFRGFQNSTKTFLPTSPRARINRRSNLGLFDEQAVLMCVRKNLGGQTSEILKNILDSSSEVCNSKYKTLYLRQKANHQITNLNKQELSAKVEKMSAKIQQMENQIKKEENQKKVQSKNISLLQAKQSKLVKLQTKLLIKQKILKQQQKLVETMRMSVNKERQLINNQFSMCDKTEFGDEVGQSLKYCLQQRMKICMDKQSRLSEQFLVLQELIQKLSDSIGYTS